MSVSATSEVECAAELQAWLEGLGLELRAINALRRELEAVQGKREGIPGKSGVLAGVDQARFIAELHGLLVFFPGKVPLRRKADISRSEAAKATSVNDLARSYMATLRASS